MYVFLSNDWLHFHFFHIPTTLGGFIEIPTSVEQVNPVRQNCSVCMTMASAMIEIELLPWRAPNTLLLFFVSESASQMEYSMWEFVLNLSNGFSNQNNLRVSLLDTYGIARTQLKCALYHNKPLNKCLGVTLWGICFGQNCAWKEDLSPTELHVSPALQVSLHLILKLNYLFCRSLYTMLYFEYTFHTHNAG